MDGRNSVGRRISLLNEDADPAPAPATRLPSLEPGLRSRTSSYASSPCLSPQTPQLLRSDSTDSAVMSTPSPLTPTFGYEESHSPSMSQSPNMSQMPYFMHPIKQEQHMMQPQYPHMMAQAYPHPPAGQVYVRAPGTERQPMPPAQPRTKKNQYPCPLASQYGCKDFFTTSGHAARHAKKHTGRKDAICPDCRKAFTRKDNMEQHRRTHQNGRNARNASKTDDDSRVKKTKAPARPKPSPIQSSQGHLQLASMMDSRISVSPRSSFSSAPAVQPMGDYMTSPYPDGSNYPPPEQYQLSPGSHQSTTFGLETLALAAAAGRQKFEA